MKKLIVCLVFVVLCTVPALAATSVVTRGVKGSALTWGEVDTNFTTLATAVDTKAGTVSPVFTGIPVVGSHLTSPIGPTLPNGAEINSTLTGTTRESGLIDSTLLVNTKIQPTAASDKINYGMSAFSFVEATNVQNIYGVGGAYNNVSLLGSGNFTTIKGQYNHVNYNGSGVANQIFGTQSLIGVTATGTITDARAFDARVSIVSGTVTNGYGLYVGTVNATNKWSIYATDATAPSYFAAKVIANSRLKIGDVPVYADNAAAITGGLSAGDTYRTGADPDLLCIVH
jgi:hypothetical protein